MMMQGEEIEWVHHVYERILDIDLHGEDDENQGYERSAGKLRIAGRRRNNSHPCKQNDSLCESFYDTPRCSVCGRC
jgi:hypothetical protein